MTEQALLRQASELGHFVTSVKEALEVIYGHGFTDEQSGDVEAPTGHFYRVDRWVAVTNSQGFTDVFTFDSSFLAGIDFRAREKAYDDWDNEEES